MGRYSWSDRKMVEDCKSIDVFWFSRQDWLIISNGPDGEKDVPLEAELTWTDTVAGELGGPNGVMPSGDDTCYGAGAGDGGWSLAGSATDDGDIGRAGP